MAKIVDRLESDGFNLEFNELKFLNEFFVKGVVGDGVAFFIKNGIMNDENKFIGEYEDLNVIDVDEALVESEALVEGLSGSEVLDASGALFESGALIKIINGAIVESGELAESEAIVKVLVEALVKNGALVKDGALVGNGALVKDGALVGNGALVKSEALVEGLVKEIVKAIIKSGVKVDSEALVESEVIVKGLVKALIERGLLVESRALSDKALVVKSVNTTIRPILNASTTVSKLFETEIKILKELKTKTLSISEIAKQIGQNSKSGVLKKSLKNLLNMHLIELTIPDKPTSPKQKYRITKNGVNRIK
ncbi:MAG: hypothetical protein HF967_08900 [Methanosarcinales archaeon]|nr:hypothetical protein [Methanosarcinales archaeon]